jgi:hypothetical protein
MAKKRHLFVTLRDRQFAADLIARVDDAIAIDI